MVSKKMKKVLRRIYQQTVFRPNDFLAERASLATQVKDLAENGLVAIVTGGTDCDGGQWSGRVSVHPALIPLLIKEINSIYEWADGPISFRLERPSVAGAIRETSRDLGLEAFENGHPHVIYS